MKPRSKRTTHDAGVTSEALARAARLLAVRSGREATGLFAGNYGSAFRGGGLEFEESRPYVAGDDVRTIDWIATARTGEPFVKRFREERNQTLLFALDTSSSMSFGTMWRSKAATAAHALALLAAAGGRAGDRTGLVVFDDGVRDEVPIGRGNAHTWALIRAAVEASATASGTTDFSAAWRALLGHTRRRATVVVFSDFRDPRPDATRSRPWSALAALARRCDVVACVVFDPREAAIPNAGPIRVTDPERPGATLVLNSGSPRARARYRAAWATRRQQLDRELRRSGVDTVWLRSDENPLHILGRFFQERAGRRLRANPR